MAGSEVDRENPLALITGASSGIGRHVARLLARRGYRTALVARREARLAELADELSPLAPSVAVPIDLAVPAAIAPAIGRLVTDHGAVDLLINNAGYNRFERFLDQSETDHDSILQVNYRAPATLTRILLPHMLQNRRGHVINVCSIATKLSPHGHGAYAAAKNALTSLTRTLAAEHAGQGVHFSSVHPGVVRTDFFRGDGYEQIERAVKRHSIAPERVARRIVRLVDHPRLELCVPRHYRMVDWLNAVSPRLVTWIGRKTCCPAKIKP